MKSALKACMVCLVCLACFAVPATANGEVAVEPAAITGTLAAEETQDALITITLPGSVPKGDVVFAFDTTGIMGLVLDAMQTEGIQVMGEIRTAIPDSQFGAVSFMDYPYPYDGYQGYTCKSGDLIVPCVYGDPSFGDYAYRVDQDLTADISTASSSINKILPGDGGDWPQDYTRVIYESQFLSWRSDAKKILVVFGDAPPHAAPSGFTLEKPWPTFQPDTRLFTRADAPYGGDPGRDALPNTADDLDYGPVIQEAADRHISIVGVYCPYKGNTDERLDDAMNNFKYMAYMTNGRYVLSDSIGEASFIAGQIVSMIQEMAMENIGELVLQVREEAYRSWVTSPDSYTDVPWPSTKSFQVAIVPPAGTADGTYSFTIDIIGDGVVLGSVPVTLQVTGGQVVVPVTVALDIKPGSCPNSFNPKEKGVLPAAILGSRDLKVTEIDRASILLTREGETTGVKPLRSSVEDVASPSEKTCSCGVRSGKEDRKKDLTLKFDAQEVVKTLGITKNDGCVRVTVTGVLKSSDPAVNGRPFIGTDYLRVLKTGPGPCDKGDKDDDHGSCDKGDEDDDHGSCGENDGKDDTGSCDHGNDGNSHGDGGCGQDGKDGDSRGDNGNGQDKGGSDGGDNRDGDSSDSRGRR